MCKISIQITFNFSPEADVFDFGCYYVYRYIASYIAALQAFIITNRFWSTRHYKAKTNKLYNSFINVFVAINFVEENNNRSLRKSGQPYIQLCFCRKEIQLVVFEKLLHAYWSKLSVNFSM